MLEYLHQIESEDWKLIEAQYTAEYAPTYDFITENKGSVSEAQEVYMEAFIFYTQLLELKGIKLLDKASQIIYSFSRKLWLLKLEKRHVDLNYVKHRREYFEMEEAFHEIASINQRSAKTAEKLAEIGEPCRTLMLECIGRRKPISDVAPRLGFSDEDRAFMQMAKCARRLIKFSESKEFDLPDSRFATLLRYVLDNPTGAISEVMEADKVCLTMISRVVVMVRSYVIRNSRMERLKQLETRPLTPRSHQRESHEPTPARKMKPVLVFSITAAIAVGISALTSFSISGSMRSQNAAQQQEADELLPDTAQTVFDEIVLPPAYVANAFIISSEGFLITTAAEIEGARMLRLTQPETGEWFGATVRYVSKEHNLALLECDDDTKKFNPPFRMNPAPAVLAEHVYALSYPGEHLLYSDGSIASASSDGNAMARVGMSMPGAPLLSPNGQLTGMITGSDSELASVLTSVKIDEILKEAEEQMQVKISLPQRNKLFYSERPQQIQMLKGCMYRVKAVY